MLQMGKQVHSMGGGRQSSAASDPPGGSQEALGQWLLA